MPFKDKQLEREWKREWHQRNKEKRRKQVNEWRARNKERKKEQDRKYRKKYRERENERKRIWCKANADRPSVKRDKAYLQKWGRWDKHLEMAIARKYVDRWGSLAVERFLTNQLRSVKNGKTERTDSNEYAARVVGYIERCHQRKRGRGDGECSKQGGLPDHEHRKGPDSSSFAGRTRDQQ